MHNCRHCRQLVALVHHLGPSTLTAMASHVRRYHPQEQLGDGPSRHEILSHFTVTLPDQNDKPPRTA